MNIKNPLQLSEMLMLSEDKITSCFFSFILLISFQVSASCFDAQRLRYSLKNNTNALKEAREKNPSLENSVGNLAQPLVSKLWSNGCDCAAPISTHWIFDPFSF